MPKHLHCRFLLSLYSNTHPYNFAWQQLFIRTCSFLRLFLSLLAERKCAVCIQSFRLTFVLCSIIVSVVCVHRPSCVCSSYILDLLTVRFSHNHHLFSACRSSVHRLYTVHSASTGAYDERKQNGNFYDHYITYIYQDLSASKSWQCSADESALVSS